MTNSELISVFVMAEEDSENIFDIYEKISEYEELYKNTTISKIKPTIYDAYELYCSHKNNIVEAVKYILDEVDFSEIANAFNFADLLDQIPEEFTGVIKQLINETLE
jgi:U3 small nucleolar RNA-associated protein 14